MKVSLRWLRDYAPLDAPLDQLVRVLVDTGTEVDRVHRGLDGVIVARITATEPVPESDRGVRFCDLDTGGDAPVRIITGAPNVGAGQLVPYAQPGTQLPGWDQPLGIRAMFGGKYHSPGMLCSAAELGIGSDADGIEILDRGVPGQPIHEILDLDVALDVDVTTNRPDCLCHLGIAREMAAALGEKLRQPDYTIPGVALSASGIAGRVTVDVREAGACPRFAVRVVEGVTIGPSPEWLTERLLAIGLRPINNVVDITNFIAHEIGEPLHAFDFDKFVAVGGGNVARVVVRRAKAGETLACLDGATRDLSEDDIVIASGETAVSLAGVMGGADTAVDASTTTILLEAATWDGHTVRATSKRLGLRSDASTLFEKGLSDSLPPQALDRAAALIVQTGRGHVLDEVIDVRARPLPRIEPITITGQRLGVLLGVPVDATEAATVLVRLGFAVEQDGGSLTVTPPHFRRDVTIPEDIVEEVGRGLGYDAVPSTLPGHRAAVRALAPEPAPDERVRDLLLGAGYDEAITWSFISAALAASLDGIGAGRTPLPLLNPLSEDWSVLRTTCLPGLVHAVAGNLKHGISDVALFEIGRVFWEGERRGLPAGSTPDGADDGAIPLPAEPLVLAAAVHAPDAAASERAIHHLQSTFTWVASDLCGTTLTFQPAEISGLRSGRAASVSAGDTAIGLIGEVDGDVAEGLEVRGRAVVAEIRLDALIPERPRLPRYRPPARFPAVVQDLAVTVPIATPAATALATIHEAGGLLLEGAELYDEYRGSGVEQGMKSWTFRLTYRAADRTLTGDEANAAHELIAAALRVRCGARVRA